MKMIGVLRVSRMRRAASMPSIRPASRTSISTRSTSRSEACSTAPSPSGTRPQTSRLCSRISDSRCHATSSSSSTINTRSARSGERIGSMIVACIAIVMTHAPWRVVTYYRFASDTPAPAATREPRKLVKIRARTGRRVSALVPAAADRGRGSSPIAGGTDRLPIAR